MAKEGAFSIQEFARFSRTTTETLRHYDRIGLLKPKIRKENGYRYYSPAQLTLVNVIRTFQDLGLTLDEISVLVDKRDAENLYSTFESQMQKISDRVNEFQQTQHLLMTIYNNYNRGLEVDESSLTIERLDAEPIILGSLNDYSDGQDDYDALNVYYNEIHEKYPALNLNYPVWGVFSKERIITGDWRWPDRYYIYHPSGEQIRPEGLYAIGYSRGGYGESDEVYRRLLNFIEQEGYEVAGGSYEEYLLNELFIPDDRQYLIRLNIQVSKKSTMKR